MYLVPDPESASMYPDATRWMAAAIIEELETMAADYREASADHHRDKNWQSIRAARLLDEAADTCHAIVALIRNEFGSSQRR